MLWFQVIYLARGCEIYLPQNTAAVVSVLWRKRLPDVSCHLNKLVISS